MGNYCCIASKHQQHKKTSIRNLQKGKNAALSTKYIDHDTFDNKNKTKYKSQLYHADLTKKDIYNSNGIDSTSSILLLSSASSTSTSLTESSRRDNSQIINHLNKQIHINPKQVKSQLNSAVKLNQVLIESPLLVHRQEDVELIKRTDLYNINENDCDELDDLKQDLSSSLSQINNSSNKLLLTKTVNSKKLSNRKRSSYLNQSLNETDRDLMKNYNYVGRRLIDNNDYDDDITESNTNMNSNQTKTKSTTTTEALNLFNWKNYRSLQKSKRSIKTIEETIQSSRSIEQWLNDFSKLKLFGGDHKKNKEKHLSLNGINRLDDLKDSKRKLSNVANLKLKRSRTSLDENDEKFLEEEEQLPVKEDIDSDDDEFQLLLSKQNRLNQDDLNLNQLISDIDKKKSTYNLTFKLIDSINQQLKQSAVNQEKEMSHKLNQFLLPRSLANSEDIDLLKWLLTRSNFRLKLVALNNEITYSNDHLVYGTQSNLEYLLIANKLNIKLEETDDEEDDLDLLIEQMIEKCDCSANCSKDSNFYFKFNPQNGQLKLDKDLIEKLLNKEKEIVSKLSQINSNAGLLLQEVLISSSSSSSNSSASDDSLVKQQQQLNILDKYRKFILETPNFKGAQYMMNIKKKQALNRKLNYNQVTPSSIISQTSHMDLKKNSLKLKQLSNVANKQTKNRLKSTAQYLTPTPLECTPISDNSSGTTSPSSSSVSPASSLSSSSYNTNQNEKAITQQTPISSSSSTTSTPASSILLMPSTLPVNDYTIQFNDLNERLFACLLSNFSCQLVDQFLATQFHTGFIRKHKQNKSFTFINIKNNLNESELMNESAGSGTEKINRLDLNVDKQTIQLCFKLNKWPEQYQTNYFKRKRINLKWPTKQLLDYINTKTCLITSKQNDQDWQLNTKLAEVYLFQSLSKQKQFQFYYLYFIFMNLTIQLSNETKLQLDKEFQIKTSKLNLFQLVSERMFAHHFYRFVEIEQEQEDTNVKQSNQCLLNLINLIKKFSSYIRFVLDKYKTFNAPNYFDLNNLILNENEYEMFLNKNISNSTDQEVANSFYEIISHDLLTALNQFDSILNNSLIAKLNQKKTSLQANLSLFNSFLDLIQFKIGNSSIDWDLNVNKCLLPAHYSAENYLYEYVYEFVAALFEQFKTKRDNFQISEQLMMELHHSILASKKLFLDDEDLDDYDNNFLNAIQHLNRDCLFEKFEEYAECVHKYLPQIRHNNQYLLFHYIWTMQVQYMAPFFNYLCDFYSIID